MDLGTCFGGARPVGPAPCGLPGASSRRQVVSTEDPGRPVVSIAAGGYSGYALSASGKVWAWGDDLEGQIGLAGGWYQTMVPVEVGDLGAAVAVGGGSNTAYALWRIRTVWAWGDDAQDELGAGDQSAEVPVEVRPLTRITARWRGPSPLMHFKATARCGRGATTTSTSSGQGSSTPVRACRTSWHGSKVSGPWPPVPRMLTHLSEAARCGLGGQQPRPARTTTVRQLGWSGLDMPALERARQGDGDFRRGRHRLRLRHRLCTARKRDRVGLGGNGRGELGSGTSRPYSDVARRVKRSRPRHRDRRRL